MIYIVTKALYPCIFYTESIPGIFETSYGSPRELFLKIHKKIEKIKLQYHTNIAVYLRQWFC